MEIINNISLNIEEEEVLRYQGCYKCKPININPVIKKFTREEIKQAFNLIEAKGIYDFVKIENIRLDSEKIDITDKLFLNVNKKMMDLFAGVNFIAFGVVTIGDRLEEKISEYFFSGEFSRAMALDAAGTVAVRNLRNLLSYLICQRASEIGLQSTGFFSPGQQGWGIEEQKNVFRTIPADKIGVRITDSYMMIPKKSLSFITGIGKNSGMSTKKEHSCKTCQAINCQFRKNFN